MENRTFELMTRWIWFLAISLGFFIQEGHAANSPEPPSGPPVIFTFNCIDGQPGDTICVPVTVTNFIDIAIAQFEIIWNSDVLDFIEIKNPGTPDIHINADFNLSGPNALKFIPLGFPIDGESLPDGTTLFEVCFRIIGFPGSTSNVGISPYFDLEVADANGVIPSDTVSCSMMVSNAVNLVGFLSSCGPDIAGNNGTIDLTVYGGTSPYNVTWIETGTGTPGGPMMILAEGGNTLLSVPQGNYDITITDAVGGTVTYNMDVDPLGLSVVTHLKNPTCYKFNNGTIWIKPVGGSAPYSYIWNSLTNPSIAGSGFIRNPGDSSLITSLPDGMYHLLVKDDNGCEEELTLNLIDNPFIFTVNDLQDATCNGSADGYIDLTISGATPDASGSYTIKITNVFVVSSNQVSIGLLNPGTYSITVSDEVSQCDTIYSFTIGATDIITAEITAFDAKCAGSNDGSVAIRGLTNGVPGPAYSYSIYKDGNPVTSTGPVGGFFNYSPLPPGHYAVIVHENLCSSDSIYFTISEPLPIQVTLGGTHLDNCLVTGSGDAWFQITNGMGPYMLNAGVGFQDGDTLENINAGNYIVTVTDSKGCTATLPFTIKDYSQNEEADITFQINGTPCEGGTITVLFQGGNPPPGTGILWSNALTSQTIPITETDTLTAQLFLGAPIFCILDDTVIVHCATKLELDITVIQPMCNDEAIGGPFTGTVIVDTANAVAPVIWSWSFGPPTTSGTISGLSPGVYYVTVTDAVDSVAIDTFEIIAPDALHLTFGIPDSTSCTMTCDGAVLVTPEDGDPSIEYHLYWDPVNPQADTNFFFQVQNLCQGINEFTVSQDGVCFYKDSIEIFSPSEIAIDLVSETDVSCHGGSDGTLQVIASGGTPGYNYQWQNGPSSALITGLAAGMHIVTVTDKYNCMQLDSFAVAEPDTLIAQIDLPATHDITCGSSNDGIITLEVSGGNGGDYTFVWSPDVSNIYQAVNLTPGTYYVTVTDPKGCSDTTSYNLIAPPPINVTWPDVAAPACFGDETLLQITDVTGGSGNYTFNINDGVLFDIGDPVMIPSGIYIIHVFDDSGCSDDSTYIIMEPNPILVSIGPDDPVVDLGDSLFISGHVDQSDNPIVMTSWMSTMPVSCDTCYGTWVFNFIPTEYTWTVTDTNGCQGSASIIVDVDYDRDVFMPTIFSPNQDGRNDEFKIYSGRGVELINYFNIYDRWGNLVHTETNLIPDTGGTGTWDGTFDGQPLSPGVYVYIAEITFLDNHTKLVYRGDVTLVR
jgi:gliding motility-associated-like protein